MGRGWAEVMLKSSTAVSCCATVARLGLPYPVELNASTTRPVESKTEAHAKILIPLVDGGAAHRIQVELG